MKKKPGVGTAGQKNWISDRKLVFEPKFIDLFEKSTDMKIKPTAKYTLIFHTTSTEPGYNIVIHRKNAEIDGEITIVETANRKKSTGGYICKECAWKNFCGS